MARELRNTLAVTKVEKCGPHHENGARFLVSLTKEHLRIGNKNCLQKAFLTRGVTNANLEIKTMLLKSLNMFVGARAFKWGWWIVICFKLSN